MRCYYKATKVETRKGRCLGSWLLPPLSLLSHLTSCEARNATHALRAALWQKHVQVWG